MALDASEIKNLVVEGIAVGFHGEPRYTKDLDLLVHVSAPAHLTLIDCLREFGAPVSMLHPDELLGDDFVFHFGMPPWRVDVLTTIPGVDFQSACHDHEALPLGTYTATCISKEWLIKAKRASGRIQDLMDLKSLGADPE